MRAQHFCYKEQKSNALKRRKMAKVDYPSLLGPGLHQMSELDFFQMTVSTFSNPRRAMLYGHFTTWASKLRALGLGGTLWLDGSFLTAKSDPDDIDVVLWSPTQSRRLQQSEQQEVVSLFDHSAVRILYGLDLYVEMTTFPMEAGRKQYWKSVFGWCHDRVTEKGIAEVAL